VIVEDRLAIGFEDRFGGHAGGGCGWILSSPRRLTGIPKLLSLREQLDTTYDGWSDGVMEERAMHMGIKRVGVDTQQEGGNLGYNANYTATVTFWEGCALCWPADNFFFFSWA
jgi:hypothetical protein